MIAPLGLYAWSEVRRAHGPTDRRSNQVAARRELCQYQRYLRYLVTTAKMQSLLVGAVSFVLMRHYPRTQGQYSQPFLGFRITFPLPSHVLAPRNPDCAICKRPDLYCECSTRFRNGSVEQDPNMWSKFPLEGRPSCIQLIKIDRLHREELAPHWLHPS